MLKRKLSGFDDLNDDPLPKQQKLENHDDDDDTLLQEEDNNCGGSDTTILDFNDANNTSTAPQGNISSLRNQTEIEILKYYLKLLKEFEIGKKDDKFREEASQKFTNGCVGLVLGYFNRFLNGLPESIGQDYEIDEINDEQKIWHAERVGEGGFGAVLKVIERNENRIKSIRAVKVIPNSTIGLSEATKASRLNCSGVVKVYNVMLIRYVCCIEMEFIECGSLGDLIRNQELHSKLTIDIIEKMLFQCCEVLSLMRQYEMVHSDIKPDNIMIRNFNFDIAIADFGLALQNETIVKQLKGGTVSYLAPELKKNTEFKPTFQSDIYALGKTFNRLLMCIDVELSKDYCTDMMSDMPETRELAFYEFVRKEIVKYKGKVSSVWQNDETLISSCLRECSDVSHIENVYGLSIGILNNKDPVEYKENILTFTQDHDETVFQHSKLSTNDNSTTIDFQNIDSGTVFQGSIFSSVKNNEIELLEYYSNLIKTNDKYMFENACVNLVLGYFNRFMNGFGETLGGEYGNEIDDGKKIWHATRIGEGELGTLLKVIERNRNEIKSIRVIKVIPNSTIGFSEAIKATRLNHSSSVKVYNVVLIRNICCIEMEYIECESLKELTQNQELLSKLTIEIIEKMLFQCCEVFALMRQYEMVHSNIKPDNIKIRNDNFDIVIGEFSLYEKRIDREGRFHSDLYKAPPLEIKCGESTFHSDIYALGKVFEKLLEGSKLKLSKDYCKELTSDSPIVRELAFYEFIRQEIVKCKGKISSVWQNDITLFSSCLDKCEHNVTLMKREYGLSIGDLLRKNRDFIMKYNLYELSINYDSKYSHLNDKKLTLDTEFMLGAIKQNVKAFACADESLRNNREFILRAMNVHNEVLLYIDESLRTDVKFLNKDEQGNRV